LPRVNIEDDLARRDFTVNALAMDMKGDVIDPFGGERDIKDRVSSARSARRRSGFARMPCA
jgi:tRNA nucleotidyltransferase (CCA-adding enzyme)